MHEKTFGNTPAAKLLTAELSKQNSRYLDKAVGKRITSTNTQVSEILNSVYHEAMSASVAANCLRMMRDEVRDSECGWYAIQLCKNVQIGAIKKAMRLCFIYSKIDTALKNPDKNCECEIEAVGNEETGNSWLTHYYMYLNDTRVLVASKYENEDSSYLTKMSVFAEDIEPNFEDILNDRSTKRKSKTSNVLENIVNNLTK